MGSGSSKATRNREEIRVVLVGKTGGGKSALGNSLLRSQKNFNSSVSSGSVTSFCSIGSRNIQRGKRLAVVDTPGLFDTRVTNATISKQLVRCITLASPGPHAFLIVLSIGRFTKEELDTVAHLRELFGEQVMKFAIIVFNHKDALEADGTTLEEFIKSSPPELQILIDECDGRVATINNHIAPGSNDRDVNAIISLVEQNIHSNGGNHYTEAMFEAAEEVFKQKVKELEEQLAKANKRLMEYEIRDQVRTEMAENDGILVTLAQGISKTADKTGSRLAAALKGVTSYLSS